MAESESKPEEKSEGTTASTEGAAAATGTKSDATSEQKSASTPEQTTEPKPESKPEAKIEPKTEAKTESKPAPKPAEKSESKPAEKAGGKRRAEPEKDGDKKPAAASTINTVRGYVATAVWILAVLAAVILAVGALMVTLDFNKNNAFVDFFVTTANNIDFGVFKDFEPGKGETQADVQTKKVLVNWGIAAVIYLVAGKILERIIRP
jgi:hypothetical protein